MNLDLKGLKPLDTSGLSELDTGGLKPLDTSGLQALDDTSSTVADARREAAGLPQKPSTEPSWLDVFGAALKNSPDLFKQSIGGAIQYAGEATPLPGTGLGFDTNDPMYQEQVVEPFKQFRDAPNNPLRNYGQKLYNEAAADLKENAPNIDPESAKGYAYDMVTSLIQMAPTIAASVVTRNPEVGMGLMGAQVFGQQYGQSRNEEGRTPEQAQMDATFYALAESIPEKMPLDVLTKSGRFFPKLLKTMGAEGVQEMFTQALETAYDAGVINKDMTWGEAWDQIKRAGIVGAGVGGGMHLAAHPFTRGEPAPAGEREKAAAAPVELKPGDAESPIPTDLIAEGRKIIAEGEARQTSDAILAKYGFPSVGSRVTVDYGDGRVASGTVSDAFTQANPQLGISGDGIKIALDNGTTFEEFADTLRRTGVRISPEAQAQPEAAQPPRIRPEEAAPVAAEPLDTGGLQPATEVSAPAEQVLARPDVEQIVTQPDVSGLTPVEEPEQPSEAPKGEGTPSNPVAVETGADLDAAAARAAEPTEAQAEAGNHRMGHVRVAGFDVSIERPRGSTRTGTAPNGKQWSVEMPAHYGYIKRSKGADGENFDVYLGPSPESDKVYVVDQIDPKTGRFDEHKGLVGFTSREEAEAAYDKAFSDGSGPSRRGAVTEMSVEQFRDLVENGDTRKPVAYRQEQKAEPVTDAKTYKGIPIDKPAKDLTDEELATITARDSTPMERRNADLARYMSDSRFFVPAVDEKGRRLGFGGVGGFEIDWKLVRDYLRDGTLPERGQRLESMAKRHAELMGGDHTPDQSRRTVDMVMRAAETGRFNDAVHPMNKRARTLFEEITGVKLPKGVNATKALFDGKPFLTEDGKRLRAAEEPKAESTPQEALKEKIAQKRAEKKPALRSDEWRAEPWTDNQGHKWRVVRGNGSDRKDIWGHYQTESQAVSAVEAARADAAKRASKSEWREIGRNADGNPLFEDQRGVRSYVANGIRHTEPVSIAPDGSIATRERNAQFEPAPAEKVNEPAQATETKQSVTISPKEAPNGVQDRVSPGDAGASAADVQPAPQDRGAGRARQRQDEGSVSDAGRAAGERAEAAERASEGPGRTEAGRGERDVNADRVPAGERSARAERPAGKPDADVKGENFAIEPGALKEGRGWKQKAQDNIRAIELMRQIEAEGRPATKAEQAELARYVGWGGIRGAFPDTDGKFEKGFEAIGERLKELLPKAEYATARRSIQYAHYTAEDVVRAMWSGVQRLGFKGGKVFEPGMGVGNFAGMMPADVAAATAYNGLELDHTTARIARLLYPKWGVRQDDFTKAPLPKDTYDLVIGNPPFADIPIKSDPEYAKHGFLLHDYFFAKSLDGVRPGGLLMFISSAGTMNKVDQAAREYLADRADLVGAIRLPGDAFEKNAGTSVTTDIIVLRKRLPGETPGDRSWVETVEVTLPNKEGQPTKGRVNRYFAEHPEMVLGEEGFFDKLYAGRYGVRSIEGQDLAARLNEAMQRLPADVMSEWQDTTARAEIDFGTAERKEGSFYVGKDGRLMQMRSGVGRPVEARGKGVEGGMTMAGMSRVKALIPIRDSLRAVYDADLKGDSANAEKARKRLNEAYDAFVERFGPINKAEISYRRPNVIQQESARAEAREEARFNGDPFDEGSFDPTDMIQRGASLAEIARQRRAAREEAEKAGRKWDEGTFNPDDMPDIVIDKRPNIEPFMDDPESYRLRAIEHYNEDTGEAKKSAVFTENVISREKAPEIKSVNDGLLYVLNKRGRVDIGEIAQAAGVSESEAIEQLGDAIYKTPGTDGTWETRDAYLSGNVRQKLRQARAAAERNPEFQRNVDALEAVQPAPLPPSEINANLGMPWIPTEVVEDFGKSLGLERIRVRYVPALAQWFVEGDTQSAAAASTWGTSDRPAPFLISDALNRTDPKIYDTHREPGGKTTQVLNVEATQAAQDKVREIKEKFSDWVWSDQKRAGDLADLYNEQYNNLVVREFDGSYLTTPGISSSWSWRPHQKRAIARIILSGNTYLGHAVGAGKTSEMIGAGMEMRRLGLVRKPMYAVPNHMLGQFTKEFYEQYPTARIAVADERRFHTDRRKQFIADVANEDLDAIIITHSAFNLIPVSDEFQDGLIQEQIDQYRDLLEDTDKHDPEQRITRRRLENAIEKLEQRLSGKKGKRKDQVFTFEEMGVDFLFVDEAHLFRKLDFATKMSNVKGISPEGSKASFDLYTKTRYLETINPGRNLVLASGTPVTNTMAELYTVSRYLQPQELAARGLSHFDAWAGAFGDTVTQLEQDPAGGYKPVTRFAKFVNVPELSAMVRQVMDVVTSRQLGEYVTRPALKGGKRQMNLAEKSKALEDYQATLAKRMKVIAERKGPPKPGDDIILNVINDGRHAAIDMRLVDPTLPNDPGSKLNLLVDNVFRIWEETKRQAFHTPAQGGFSKKPVDFGPATQMIFANLGIGDSRQFSVTKYVVSELVRRGVPKSQIALIADYKTHVAKQRLFNDMNDGKVRVLIGSTSKMATGVNAQRRLYALHNLDPLWYPADDEQRNGRIIRQGNMNPEVEIHDYSTKGTYDSTMWGLMETKARFIQGFFEGDPSIRDMEDLGEASQYEQAKAMTTADPRLIQLTEYKQDLEKALRRKAAFERELYAVRSRIAGARDTIKRADERIPQIEADIARRQDTSGDNFKAKAGKKTFTERAEFGDALLGQLENLAADKTERKDVKIGEIGGFDIKADVRKNHFAETKDTYIAEPYLAREGGFETDIKVSGSARGLVQSVENALRGFESDLETVKRRKAEAEKVIADFEPQLGKTFTGQQQIDDLAGKVKDLEGQLAAEAAINQQASEKLALKGDPVANLTGNELGVAFRGPDDMPALRRAAQRWYDENLIGTTATMKDGSVVKFGRRGLRKSTFGGKGDVLLRSVPAIRAIIERGDVVYREPGTRPEIRERLIIAAPVLFDGRVYDMAVSVHRMANGQYQYDFTRNRDVGSPGVGVPGGIADESPLGQPALETAPDKEGSLALSGPADNLNLFFMPGGDTLAVSRAFSADLDRIAADLQARLRKLRIDDKIALRLTSKIRSVRDGRVIQGAEGRYYRGLLQVALGARDRTWTLNHEAIHAMRDLGLFRDAEWNTLERAARADTGRMAEIRRRYGGLNLPEEALTEEAIADMFADWAAGRMQARGFIRDAFERIMAFLRAVYDALTHAGYRSMDDLFTAVERGYVGRRRDARGRFVAEPDAGIDEPGPMGLSERFMVAWHGSPHDFDQFTTARIGTGEGNQSFGWGLYFAGNRKVAEYYRSALTNGTVTYKGPFGIRRAFDPYRDLASSQAALAVTKNDYKIDAAIEQLEAERDRFAKAAEDRIADAKKGDYLDRLGEDTFYAPLVASMNADLKKLRKIKAAGGFQKPGRLYQVDLAPEEDEYLLWDKKLSEQSAKVKAALRENLGDYLQADFDAHKTGSLKAMLAGDMTGEQFYQRLADQLGDRAASMTLYRAGIPGIKYLDAFSRGSGTGTFNYVIFDDSQVSIEEKYSIQRPARPEGAKDTATFDNPESEKRWQEARKGVAGQESLVTRTESWLTKIANGFIRHFINLPNTPEYADVREQLRKLEAAPQASKEQVIRILRDLTKGMTPADLDLFTRKVVLDDLAWESEQDHDLPFGMTSDDVTREKAKIDQIMERRPDLAEAVRQRKLIVRQVANDLVAAGVLRREQVRNPAYYRHQVLDYARATVQMAKGTGNKLRSPHWARRMGSTLDINANLLEAEFDWLQKAFTDIATANTINWIKRSGHNIRADVIAQARAYNEAHVQKALARDMQQNGYVDDKGRQTSPLNEEWNGFRQRIAIGLGKVRKAIEDGELFVPEEFEDAARNLTGEADNDASIFPFLAWVLDNDEAGAPGAAQAFKAISQRKAWVKRLLGERYADTLNVGSLVKRFAPDGYVTWQPDEGKLLFTAKSLPEHVVDKFTDLIAQEGMGPIRASDVRAAMDSAKAILAVGGNKFEMVIPQELAATLNNIRDQHQETLIEATLETPLRWWKRWVLINPRRVIKYNLNNMSGDLDAVIAGNAKALRRMPQAIRELYQVMIKGQAPSARYREAVERGVFDSGLSIQEIPDINLLSEFEHLIERPSALKRPDRFALSGLMRVWRALQKYTQFRENWLRYAAYLDYVERLEAGESMKSIGYGAANPKMVDAVTDKKDKAALLARELVGDYGAVSHWGQSIRKKVIPFWSWMEINTKRYWRLSANAFGQGVGEGFRAAGIVGAGLGLRTTLWLGLRMVMLYALVQLWNNLVMGDDEDDLDPEERSRLHINLGRGADGQIRLLRFQGSFSDFIDTLGFPDAVAALSEIEKGRGSFVDVINALWHAPVNKLASGLTPVLKIPVESATGYTFWPDVFNPMPIRDEWRNLFRSFSLENEYDLLLGKPSRGYGRSLQDSLFTSKDAGENAYNRIKSLSYNWLRREKGQEGSSNFSTPRSEALYEWRLAKRYGDEEAAAAARQRLRELGVHGDDLRDSIKRAHPLGAIAIKDRAKFIRSLSDAEREQLDQAIRWYRETFTY